MRNGTCKTSEFPQGQPATQIAQSVTVTNRPVTPQLSANPTLRSGVSSCATPPFSYYYGLCLILFP